MMALTATEGIATLTLSHPPVNAIGDEFIARFDTALAELEASPDCRILHLRSEQKVFCAGADLVQMRERFDRPDGLDLTRQFVSRFQLLLERLERLPQVTLAEIGGAAMGGGLELALACDLRVAAADAKLGLTEARLGLIPGGGGTQRLTRLCGRAVASRLIFGAETIDGAEALRLGLVQWTAPHDEIATHATEIARSITALPAGALRASKSCITAALESGNAGYNMEIEETLRLSTHPDTRQRLSAFFAARRADRRN